MSKPEERFVGTVVTLPESKHELFRTLAKANKRSLQRHMEWVLERYIESQEADGA